MNHIAWSCDGKKLGAVGIDKIGRVWQPEKSVCVLRFGPWLRRVKLIKYRWSSGLRLPSREDM